MPTGELPPPAGYRFNTGIGVLPQFRNSPPGIRDLPNEPSVEVPTSNYPSSLGSPDLGGSYRPNAVSGYPVPGGNPSWRDNASRGFTGYPPPGTPQDWRSNAGGITPSWRDNATYSGNPPSSIFDKIGNLFGSIFNHDGPNSTPTSDSTYSLAPSQNAPGASVYNTGRFTDAPAFFTTLAQAQFPGSMIGPTSGLVSNPYNPNASSASRYGGSHSGLFGATQAYQAYVNSHTQV